MKHLLIAAGLLAPLALVSASGAMAQQQQWKKEGGDRGTSYGAHECQPSVLSGRHASWACMPHCKSGGGGYCWEGRSDAYYVCTDSEGRRTGENGYRHLEYTFPTDQPCGKKDWAITKRIADSWGETWQNNRDEPRDEVAKPNLPSTDDDLPPSESEGLKPGWGGGFSPWHKEDPEKQEEKKSDTDSKGGGVKSGDALKLAGKSAEIRHLSASGLSRAPHLGNLEKFATHKHFASRMSDGARQFHSVDRPLLGRFVGLRSYSKLAEHHFASKLTNPMQPRFVGLRALHFGGLGHLGLGGLSHFGHFGGRMM